MAAGPGSARRGPVSTPRHRPCLTDPGERRPEGRGRASAAGFVEYDQGGLSQSLGPVEPGSVRLSFEGVGDQGRGDLVVDRPVRDENRHRPGEEEGP